MGEIPTVVVDPLPPDVPDGVGPAIDTCIGALLSVCSKYHALLLAIVGHIMTAGTLPG